MSNKIPIVKPIYLNSNRKNKRGLYSKMEMEKECKKGYIDIFSQIDQNGLY